MQLGTLEVQPVYDGHGVIAATGFFVNTSPLDWAPHQAYLHDGSTWDFPVGGYLVRTEGRTVLVDVGLGPHVRGFMSGGAFLDELATAGVAPEQVTDVVLTHLHADHFGWLAVDGSSVFRNAAVRCHQDEWDYFVEGEGRAVLDRPVDPLPGATADGTRWIDKLTTVSDQVETWTEHGEVLPGVESRSGAGHTPGSSLIVLVSGGRRAILVGDALHCPAQLTEPDWQPIGDVDPAQASDLRRMLARELVGTSDLVGGPHFPGLALGTVSAEAHTYSWTQVTA